MTDTAVPTQVLGTTRARSFEPGTNLRGTVPGAAWTYLLPSLDVGAVLCVGVPTSAALRRLADVATRVDILAPPGFRAPPEFRTPPMSPTGHAADIRSVDARTAFEAGPHDLAWVVSRDRAGAEAAPAIARAGLVYEERSGVSSGTTEDGNAAGTLDLRLSPTRGEVRTAVPLSDERTIDFFGRRGLEESWLARSLAAHGVPGARRLAALPIVRAGSEAGRHRFGRLHGPARLDLHEAPAYLRRVALGGGVDLAGHRWGLAAGGDYPTQKVVFYLFPPQAPRSELRHVPSIVVKLSQDEASGALLGTAYRGLRRLAPTEFGLAGRTPVALFMGVEHGRAVVGERAIDGRPFTSLATPTPDSNLALDVVDGLIDLARETQKPADGTSAAEAVRDLRERFNRTYAASPDCRRILDASVDAIASTRSVVPLVFSHGDPGPHNLLVTSSGRVTLVDWENADPHGLPLWDLFAFLRGFTTWASRRTRPGKRVAAIRRTFVDGSPFTPLVAGSVERYVEAMSLDPALVEPLFWTCWMTLAVREAPRLTRDRLESGFQLRALEMLAANAAAPVLRWLLRPESVR